MNTTSTAPEILRMIGHDVILEPLKVEGFKSVTVSYDAFGDTIMNIKLTSKVPDHEMSPSVWKFLVDWVRAVAREDTDRITFDVEKGEILK